MPKTVEDWKKLWTTVGGRRFLLAMGAGITTTALQWFGKLDPAGSTYALVVSSTVGVYIAAMTHEAVKTSSRSD